MTVDLSAILDQVQPVIDSAVESVGSEWTITRNPGGDVGPVNRSTGRVVDPTPPTTVATAVLALWAPDTGAGAQQPEGPNLPGSVEAGTMVLTADVVDVQERDVFTCTLSRDPRLVGRAYRATKVPDGSAGAVRLVRCEAL